VPEARGSPSGVMVSEEPRDVQGMSELDERAQPETVNFADDERLILLCCISAPILEDFLPDAAMNFRYERFVNFKNTAAFVRWLFDQERGCAVRPSSILVTGFREAQPCMAALSAAHSGDTSNLRPDAWRPELRSPLTHSSSASQGPLRIAVAAIVVYLDSPERQQDRAMVWFSGTKDLMPSLDVCIVQSEAQLAQALEALVSSPCSVDVHTVGGTTDVGRSQAVRYMHVSL